MSDLVARNISVAYRRKQVLSGLSLTVKAGSLTAIVGPNGSGKSTLLKALTAEVPFTGQVLLNGLDTASLPAWRLAEMRAVLPQATALAFPFTVLEVVRLGVTAGAGEDLALRALERVGLRHHADSLYQEISGGEQQRAQFARVLSQVWEPVADGRPRWLLLDEPVSSLDIGHQLDVMAEARRFADAGGGVIAVMHDLNLSAMFAHRILVMSAGRIVSDGLPASAMTSEVLSRAYGCAVNVGRMPGIGGPVVLPQMAEAGSGGSSASCLPATAPFRQRRSTGGSDPARDAPGLTAPRR